MSTIKKTLEKYDAVDFKNCDFKWLMNAYRTLSNIRVSLDNLSTETKKREVSAKDEIFKRMRSQDMETLKTAAGRASISEQKTVITYDDDMFFKWLQGSPEHIPDILKKSPYSQNKAKEFDSGGILPPGLKYLKGHKITITKSK